MKCFVSSVCVLSLLVSTTIAAPLSASTSLQVGASTEVSSGGNGGGNPLTNILSNIDLPGLLQGVNSFVKLVGVFCPPLSQVLDNVIQNVTSTAFRIFGRIILRGGGLGGGSSNSEGGGGQKVNVVLPTFPPDDYEDDEEEVEGASSTTVSSEAVPVELSRDTEQVSTESAADTLFTSASDDDSNNIAKRHVRVIREAEAAAEEDQEGAESAPHPGQDLSNVEIDDQDRDKRYLPFGGSVEGHAGGGSGNFLFDIIRNTADRAARTVGTVYRMVAGTENLGLGLSGASQDDGQTQTTLLATAASHVAPAKLVAGSGATEESDEKEHAPGGVAEVDIAKSADGYTEGIPGPITRLFVIANRGLANLVQDLILRLAQTSEKLVNFKARLITSLI